MRRVPIACCLEEGTEWLPWLSRYAGVAQIRIYDDGKIEDDILAAMRRRKGYPDLKRRKLSRFGVKHINRVLNNRVFRVGHIARLMYRAA